MDQNNDEFVCPICLEAIADAAAATKLPPFTSLPPPSFSWTDTLEGEVFAQHVSDAYEEIVH